MAYIKFLSKDEYLKRVRSLAAPGDDIDELVELVRGRLPSDEREQELRETMESFCFDPNSGRAGILEIVPLASAKAALARSDFRIDNWHYDRIAGCLLINLRGGVHEMLSASLYDVYRGSATGRKSERAAELFIGEGLGWFRSASSYGRALKGAEVKLTAQEQAVFGTVFMTMD